MPLKLVDIRYSVVPVTHVLVPLFFWGNYQQIGGVDLVRLFNLVQRGSVSFLASSPCQNGPKDPCDASLKRCFLSVMYWWRKAWLCLLKAKRHHSCHNFFHPPIFYVKLKTLYLVICPWSELFPLFWFVGHLKPYYGFCQYFRGSHFNWSSRARFILCEYMATLRPYCENLQIKEQMFHEHHSTQLWSLLVLNLSNKGFV